MSIRLPIGHWALFHSAGMGGWVLSLAASCALLNAFPPAPHHSLYGVVRNQFGDPLGGAAAAVILEFPSGAVLQTDILDGLDPGVNYRLDVPMDSGTSGDVSAYKPTAMKPFFNYRLKVRIGQTTYLPIQMNGTLARIGLPGQKSRVDLTLGIDSDGDGLPDAWEQSLMAVYGGALDGIRPQDDSDGDGMSNLDEYLAGTYAHDPADGFRLDLRREGTGFVDLQFTVVRGRTYELEASTNLISWSPVRFSVLKGGIPDVPQGSYSSQEVRAMDVRVPAFGGGTNLFFRAMVR